MFYPPKLIVALLVLPEIQGLNKQNYVHFTKRACHADDSGSNLGDLTNTSSKPEIFTITYHALISMFIMGWGLYTIGYQKGNYEMLHKLPKKTMQLLFPLLLKKNKKHVYAVLSEY
jgi:hypothetical protein